MSITVVIPTRDRPQYLTTVLESVQRQTALSQIEKVLVSENGVTDDSRIVCENFEGLDITYTRQQQPFNNSVGHLSWIIQQSDSEYTAMLHDDDWWYPTHLQNALEGLKQEGVSCYFSNFVFAENEIFKNAFFHYPAVFSHFTNERSVFHYPEFTLSDIAAMCYLFTPFHMSAMVAKTSSLKQASSKSLALSKPFYADRVLYPSLAVYGKIVLNPQILSGIRIHAQSDSSIMSEREKVSDHMEGSIKIENLAKEHGIDIFKIWEKIKDRVSTQEWGLIQHIYKFYLGECLEKDNPFFSTPVSPKGKQGMAVNRLLRKIFQL